MNRVLQPRPLVVLGLNVWMGTAAGADELVEVPYREFRPSSTVKSQLSQSTLGPCSQMGRVVTFPQKGRAHDRLRPSIRVLIVA